MGVDLDEFSVLFRFRRALWVPEGGDGDDFIDFVVFDGD